MFWISMNVFVYFNTNDKSRVDAWRRPFVAVWRVSNKVSHIVIYMRSNWITSGQKGKYKTLNEKWKFPDNMMNINHTNAHIWFCKKVNSSCISQLDSSHRSRLTTWNLNISHYLTIKFVKFSIKILFLKRSGIYCLRISITYILYQIETLG